MPTTRPVVAGAPTFEELYTKYRSSFVVIARSYVRDRMAAEDLVTEAFLVYWENRERLANTNIPAYISTCVKHRCLNWLESQRQHCEAHRDIRSAAYRRIRRNIAQLEDTLPHALVEWEVGALVEQELRRMPERMRKVYLAHQVEQMSYKEIAALYGLSERQINYEIHNAKERLIVALKDYSPLILILLHLR